MGVSHYDLPRFSPPLRPVTGRFGKPLSILNISQEKRLVPMPGLPGMFGVPMRVLTSPHIPTTEWQEYPRSRGRAARRKRMGHRQHMREVPCSRAYFINDELLLPQAIMDGMRKIMEQDLEDLLMGRRGYSMSGSHAPDRVARRDDLLPVGELHQGAVHGAEVEHPAGLTTTVPADAAPVPNVRQLRDEMDRLLGDPVMRPPLFRNMPVP